MTSPVCRPLGLAAAVALARAAEMVVTCTPLPASQTRVSIMVPPRLEPIMPPWPPLVRAVPGTAADGAVYAVGCAAVDWVAAGRAAAPAGTVAVCDPPDAANAADPTRSRLAVTSTVQGTQCERSPVRKRPLIADLHHGRKPARRAAAGTSRGRPRHARSDGPVSPRESPGPVATDPDAPDGQATAG